jgi:hypothetical protein
VRNQFIGKNFLRDMNQLSVLSAIDERRRVGKVASGVDDDQNATFNTLSNASSPYTCVVPFFTGNTRVITRSSVKFPGLHSSFD